MADCPHAEKDKLFGSDGKTWIAYDCKTCGKVVPREPCEHGDNWSAVYNEKIYPAMLGQCRKCDWLALVMPRKSEEKCPSFGTHQFFNLLDPDSCCFACGYQPWVKGSRPHHPMK